MNLVFVNHMHPSTPHVSGMRSWFFARELANRGHRVVQLCEWREGTEPAPPPEALAHCLQEHDWREPLLLAIRPQRRALLERIRSARTPAPVRKVLVSWSYLRHSGMFTDFSQATLPYQQILAEIFQPQATWGLFGNTDCWLIAQQLARRSGCPWVADMKDSWEFFLRRPLRSILAECFQDMAACTANAGFNADVLQRWFPHQPTLVYSGVDPCFLMPSPQVEEPQCFRLTLTGSVHNVDALARLAEALQAWFISESGPSGIGSRKPEVIYAGADAQKVRPVLRPLAQVADIRIHGYLPLPELAALCQSASANIYIWNPKTFHHKLLELLSCGRPVIAYPGETEESKQLATDCGGYLLSPTTEEELIDVLSRLLHRTSQPEQSGSNVQTFSWAAQAHRMEEVLMQTIHANQS
jgi:glycosyltransferase involved in cell wall biosynthesis